MSTPDMLVQFCYIVVLLITFTILLTVLLGCVYTFVKLADKFYDQWMDNRKWRQRRKNQD